METIRNTEDNFFQWLAAEDQSADLPSRSAPATLKSAPATLKSKTYSALMNRQEESGPLLSVSRTKPTRGLCVFENLVEVSPLSAKLGSFNFCSFCHARLLAEKMENAPIHWRNCPYAGFQTRNAE